jgi:hypothetical protein
VEGEGEGIDALREKQGIWSLPQLCLAGNTMVALTKALYAFTYKTLQKVLGLKQKRSVYFRKCEVGKK